MAAAGIVTCSDGRMLPAAACALVSAYRQLHATDADLFLIGIDLSPDDGAKAEVFFRQHGAAVRIIAFELPVEFEGRSGKWSPATWARLYLDELLPTNIERLLYLDADTLAVAPLDELFAVDLRGQCAAAVEDITMANRPKLNARRAIIGMAAEARYFNAGMIFFDWQASLRTGLMRAARDVFARGTKLPANDQDALNLVLNGNWLRLDKRWNAQMGLLPYIADPAIVHFTGGAKPWRRNRARLSWFAEKLYRRLLADSPWPQFCEHSTVIDRVVSFSGHHARQARRFSHYRRVKSYFSGD